MTNREYLNTLTEEELVTYIYDGIVARIAKRYTSSKGGITNWLLSEHIKADDIENVCSVRCYMYKD